MGLFLQTAIIKGCNLAQAEKYIEKLSDAPNPYEIVPAECRVREQHGDVFIHFNDYCNGYESLAKDLSIVSQGVAMLLYIYDGDFWGYQLYDKGTCMDFFSPMPDYFVNGLEEAEIQKSLGNSKVIAEYFNIQEDSIKNYLVYWTVEMQDGRKAYEGDRFGCQDWQMVDFLEKLGYQYEEEA